MHSVPLCNATVTIPVKGLGLTSSYLRDGDTGERKSYRDRERPSIFSCTYTRRECIHTPTFVYRQNHSTDLLARKLACVFSYPVYSFLEQERFPQGFTPHMLNTFVRYHAVNDVLLSRSHPLVSRLKKQMKFHCRPAALCINKIIIYYRSEKKN